MGTQQGTQRSTLPGTHIADYQSHTDKLSTQSGTYVGTQIRQGVYPTVYPPGVDIAGTQTGTRLPVKPRRKDTRAQLNLKISLEKMFQLRDFCESTGRSQKEAI